MKIEIAHDMLARTVYQKADVDDKTRLKVASFIHNKYVFYQETNKLLNSDDIAYISHFDNQIVLSNAESKFIADSRRKVKIVNWSIWISIGIIFGALIWLVISNNSAWKETQKTNIALAEEQKALMVTKDSIQQLLDNENELKKQVMVQDDRLNKSKEELEVLATERKILIIELERTNQALREAYAKIEAEQKILQRDQVQLEGALKKKIAENTLAKRTLSNTQKSLRLSQKAQLLMASNGGNPTDLQIKEAFRLAREAWERFEDNSQAMDVLSEIRAAKLNKSNGGFLDKEAPKYTYTKSQIKQIINKLDPQYGKMSPSQISTYLK